MLMTTPPSSAATTSTVLLGVTTTGCPLCCMTTNCHIAPVHVVGAVHTPHIAGTGGPLLPAGDRSLHRIHRGGSSIYRQMLCTSRACSSSTSHSRPACRVSVSTPPSAVDGSHSGGCGGSSHHGTRCSPHRVPTGQPGMDTKSLKGSALVCGFDCVVEKSLHV